jgi:hypothetical protein
MSATTKTGQTPYYFIPAPSQHPAMTATAFLFIIAGAAMWVNGHDRQVVGAGACWVVRCSGGSATPSARARAYCTARRRIVPLEHGWFIQRGGYGARRAVLGLIHAPDARNPIISCVADLALCRRSRLESRRLRTPSNRSTAVVRRRRINTALRCLRRRLPRSRTTR